MAKDQALLAQAESDLARYEQLNKQDSIAQQQVADQEALVAQDKAAIATDQAMIKTAELNVAYTHIVSPITGRVGLRLVDPGNYLQPSDATGIVVITQIDPISVVFTTPEDNLPRISARLNSGAKLKVTVLDRDNVHALATGTLTTYDSQIDITTGTIRMRATFANPNGVLFPQQFVNVRLLVDTMTGATLAPNPAIQLGASGNFVYLLNDDSTVSKRDVVTGPGNGKHTVIKSGLKAGDKVVIDGVDRLRDGASVTVVDSPATPGRRPRPARVSSKAAANRRPDRPMAAASIIGIATIRPAPAQGCRPAARRGSGRPGAAGRARRRRPRRRPAHRRSIRRRAGRRRKARRNEADGASGRGGEPVPHLHRSSGRDQSAHDRDPARRHRRFPLPAALGPARGRLSDDPGPDLLSRREPGGDDLVGDGAARAAVRPDAEPEPDDVAKLGRRVGHHVAVRARHRPRHRRAGSAGGDQRRRQSFARRPAGAADLRQGQSGRRADPDARRRFGLDEADRGRGHHRNPPGAETVAIARRRSGFDFRRPAPRRPHPRQSARPFRRRHQPRRFAHDDRQPQRQRAQGKFRRAGPILGDQRQRSDPRSERLRELGHRLPQ